MAGLALIDQKKGESIAFAFFLGLPSVAGKPGPLKDTGVTPIRGKTIQIARALLVTAGSEGSDRK
jgi:hypothetical protein